MPIRMYKKRWKRVGLLAALIGLTASFGVTAFVPAHAEQSDAAAVPRIVGELPARVTLDARNRPPQIIVDQTHKLGFAVGTKVNGAPIPKHDQTAADTRYLVMYDLEQLSVADAIALEVRGPGTKALNDLSSDPAPDVWTRVIPAPIETWGIDEARQRIYLTLDPATQGAGLCANTGGLQGPSMVVVDYAGGELSVSRQTLPCPAGLVALSFVARTAAIFTQPSSGARKLYIAGLYAHDQPRSSDKALANVPGSYENEGASLLVMQIDVSGDQPSFDWYLDLKEAGCGRRGVPFVDRIDDDVISYCNDVRAGSYSFTGQNGYVVRVPLKNDWPVTTADEKAQVDPVTGLLTDAVIRRTPALPGVVTPVADAASGKLLLATADSKANGNAVWVFDPGSQASRFVGVVSAGYGDQPPGNAGFGFDPVRGRGYLLTIKGLLVAPIRHKPLPAGLVYSILINPDAADTVPFLWQDSDTTGRPAPIAVVAGLAHPRLLFPVTRGSCPASRGVDDKPANAVEQCPRYVVVDDFTMEPEDPEPEDLDALTQDLEEQDGKTTSNATGAGAVAAARLLIAGGLPRAVNHKDPNCTGVPPGLGDWTVIGGDDRFPVPAASEPQNYEGACLADQLISKGNRDVSFSAASIDTGSSTGAVADAGGAVFASADNADDSDVRRVGSCGEDNVNAVQPRSQSDQGDGGTATTSESSSTTSTTAPPNGWRDGCDQFYDGASDNGVGDPRAGTKGPDGTGYPIRAAHCGDFGDAPASGDQAQGTDNLPGDTLSSSNVECDAGTNTAKATSTGDALAVFTGGGVVTVARLFSSIETTRTPEGQVTKALASARGITIGPLTIGEVRAEAETKAHGRPGTTSTTYTRQWCYISGDGVSIPGCIDPSDPANQSKVDELNDKLGTLRIELTPVKTVVSPQGYQALALKDPEAAQADAAVNDDDSFSVPAMQIVFYNDGAEGRNRYIVQLANIRSESHYGITESPDYAADESQSEEAPPEQPVDVQTPPEVPTQEVFDEPVAEAPPQAEYVELTDAQPVSSSEPALSLPAPGRPFLERLLRVPAEIVKNAVRLLVSKPGEFALLFALWTLLAAPVYLALRRRSFAQSLIE